MSSNIKIQRICQYCGQDFIAKTTTTLYCSHKCNSADYKAKQRATKIDASNKQTIKAKTAPIEVLKAKEFLTAKEVAALINCSIRTVYNQISSGSIKSINLAQRITRIKRVDIDMLFDKPKGSNPVKIIQNKQVDYGISECYYLKEVQAKYNISESGLNNLIVKHNIPKIKQGWYVYVPKMIIDNIFNNI